MKAHIIQSLSDQSIQTNIQNYISHDASGLQLSSVNSAIQDIFLQAEGQNDNDTLKLLQNCVQCINTIRCLKHELNQAQLKAKDEKAQLLQQSAAERDALEQKIIHLTNQLNKKEVDNQKMILKTQELFNCLTNIKDELTHNYELIQEYRQSQTKYQANIEAKLQELKQENMKFMDSIVQLQNEKLTEVDKNAMLTTQINDLNNKIDTLEHQSQQLTVLLQQYQQKLSQTAHENLTLEKLLKNSQLRIEDLQNEQLHTSNQNKMLYDQLTLSEQRAIQLQEQIEKMTEKHQEVITLQKQQHEKDTDKLKNLQETNAQLSAQISSQQSQLAQKEQLLQASKVTIDQLQHELQRNLQQINKLQHAANQRETKLIYQIDDLYSNIDQLKEQIKQYKLQLKTLQRIEQMAKFVSDEYNMYSTSSHVSTQIKSEMLNTKHKMLYSNKRQHPRSMLLNTDLVHHNNSSTDTFSNQIGFQDQEQSSYLFTQGSESYTYTQENLDKVSIQNVLQTKVSAKITQEQCQLNESLIDTDRNEAIIQNGQYTEYTGMYTIYSLPNANAIIDISSRIPKLIAVRTPKSSKKCSRVKQISKPLIQVEILVTPKEYLEQCLSVLLNGATKIRDKYNLDMFISAVRQMQPQQIHAQFGIYSHEDVDNFINNLMLQGTQITSMEQLSNMLLFNQYVEYSSLVFRFNRKFDFYGITDQYWNKLFQNVNDRLSLVYSSNLSFVVIINTQGTIFKETNNGNHILQALSQDFEYDILIVNSQIDNQLLQQLRIRSLHYISKSKQIIKLKHPESLISATLCRVTILNLNHCVSLQNLNSMNNVYHQHYINGLTNIKRIYSQDDVYKQYNQCMIQQLLQTNKLEYIRVLSGVNIINSTTLEKNVQNLRFFSTTSKDKITIRIGQNEMTQLKVLISQGSIIYTGDSSAVNRVKKQLMHNCSKIE